jgi:hypothetical protein
MARSDDERLPYETTRHAGDQAVVTAVCVQYVEVARRALAGVSIHRVSAPPMRARAMDREAFALRADAESAGSTADQFDAMTERTIGLLRSESGASC